MKNGKCPKCGSENIYRSPSKGIMDDRGNWVFIKPGDRKDEGAYLLHYACASCYYSESYVADSDSMHNIQAEWLDLNAWKPKRKNDKPASMQTDFCPKCGSHEVQRYHRTLQVRKALEPATTISIIDNICFVCGYLESYVATSSLAQLEQRENHKHAEKDKKSEPKKDV